MYKYKYFLTFFLLAWSLSGAVLRPQAFHSSNHPNYNPATKKVEKLDRELMDADSTSIDRLNERIEELHVEVKLCLDNQFSLPPQDMMAYTDILYKCVGENYSIVLNSYKNILYEVKEITKERIKNSMQEGFCDDILFMCIEFFKAVELFIKLDFDITKSLEFNRKELERKITPSKLQYLIQISSSKLDDYDQIRDNLVKEREFIGDYFEESKDNYQKQHAANAAMIKDKIIE